jgi:hypothetical protein
MATETPNVFLHGGPDLPPGQRVRYTADTTEKVVVFRGHRYDHFHPTSATVSHDGCELTVFSWSGSTYVAE